MDVNKLPDLAKIKQCLDLKVADLSSDVPNGVRTIREWMTEAVAAIFVVGECFDGKRPLGMSDWERLFDYALILTGAVDGTISEYRFDGIDTPILSKAGSYILNVDQGKLMIAKICLSVLAFNPEATREVVRDAVVKILKDHDLLL